MKEQQQNLPESDFRFIQENTNKSEDPAPDDIANILHAGVVRHDHFASDANDEFKITRENDQHQGIFKVWASPVIPILEGKSANQWATELKDKPLALFESLEQWRSFSDIADRRLQQIFANRLLPEDPKEATVELFMRLRFAFAYASPFYNLEALVDDKRKVKNDNPIDLDQKEGNSGKLDLVGMRLPSAFKNLLLADENDWGNTNWDILSDQVNELKQSFFEGKDNLSISQYKLLIQISKVAGIKPEEVLFAANALQYIPKDVGGKKDDYKQSDSISKLSKALNEKQTAPTSSSIAQGLNALIRFLNWTPSIQLPDNTQNKFWKYGAVCDTAGTLLELLKQNPEIAFIPDFELTFTEFLAPQLDNLDATSAKGRFLMQMLSEMKFNPSITEDIKVKEESFNKDVSLELQDIKRSEEFIDLSKSLSPYLVGGKAVGIARMIQVFPENVKEGFVVTSEAIDAWLKKIDNLTLKIEELNSATFIDQKINIGEEIVTLISKSDPPQNILTGLRYLFENANKIILRSSSFDEDVDIIGRAPGVYESALNIDKNDSEDVSKGIKTVISSFFSEKAIAFRENKGLRHYPIMAIIAQEYIDSPGGTIFVSNDKIDLNVAGNPSLINVAGSYFEKHGSENETILYPQKKNNVLLTNAQLEEIKWIAQKTNELFGASDIEFVVNPSTARIKILQMRSLEDMGAQIENSEIILATTTIEINSLDSLPSLEGEFINLRISEDIDLEKFQGQLFRWIDSNNSKIVEITYPKELPRTCHFANIIGSLGIRLTFEN